MSSYVDFLIVFALVGFAFAAVGRWIWKSLSKDACKGETCACEKKIFKDRAASEKVQRSCDLWKLKKEGEASDSSRS